MNLTKGFVAAALVLPLAVGMAGCDNATEVAQRKQDIETHGIKKLDMPVETLREMGRGSYEIKIETSKGSKDCVVSVIPNPHGYDGVIVNYCHP